MEIRIPRRLLLLVLICFSVHSFGQKASLVFPKSDHFIEVNPLLQWNVSDSADSYELILSRNSNLSPRLLSLQTPLNSIQTSLKAGVYYWRVMHLKSGNAIDSTTIGHFQVIDLFAKDSLKLWLRADSNITESMGQVSGWKDLSAAGIQLSQTATARQATVVPAGLNGKDLLYFDLTRDVFTTPVELKSRNYLIATIYNFRENSNRATRAITGTSNWLMGPYTGFYRIFDGAGGFLPSIPTVEDQYILHSAFSRNDTLHNLVNSIDYATRLGSKVPGRLDIGKSGGDFFHGNFAEIVVLSGSMSDASRDSINSFLMDRYAPPVNLGLNQVVCGFPQEIDAYKDSYSSYAWSTGSSDSLIQINAPGSYRVTVTDIFGRTSVDSMLYIQDTNSYIVDFGFSDSTICEGNSLSLNAGLPIYSYTWNTGDTSFQIEADSQFQYVVSVQNCLGGMSSDTVNLTLNKPVFSLGADTSICFNTSLQLLPDSAFNQVNYFWSNGSTAPSIVVDTAKTYYLRVEDAYQCSYSDTLNLAVDSSLFPMSLGPDTNICIGNSIGLVEPIAGISSYLWSNGLTTPQLPIDSASNYHLRIEKDGCINRDTVVVSIKGDAPFANFTEQNNCLLDQMQFVDLSSAPLGDTLVSWKWYFGDGDSSNLSNPSHQYPAVNTYFVDLQVTTNKGCVDTTKIEVEVNPKPVVDFESNSYCSKQATNFFDRSTISAGIVVKYTWDFGDTSSSSNTSSDRKPSHIYDTLGIYQIQLIAESDEGCKDTTRKSQHINPSPNVQLTYTGSCFEDSTKLSGNVTVAADSIFDHYWLINTNFVSVDPFPALKFQETGKIPVSLRVRSDSMCSTIVRDSIEIYEKPVANFIAGDNCVDLPFDIQNASSIGSGSIAAFRYIFNGSDTSLNADPNFTSSTAGDLPLRMRVVSNQGCVDSIEKQVFVSELPEPRFTVLNRQSGVPFKLAVENESIGASSYSWSFGNGDSQMAAVPDYTYIDTGSYVLQLTAANDFGCLDSSSSTVKAIPYFLDAALGKVILSETNEGFLKLRVQLLNAGSNTIENISLAASFADQFKIQEQFTGPLYRASQAVFEFTGSFIQNADQKIDYACVQILKVNGVNDDVDTNNEVCEPGFRQALFVDLFPNPVSDQLQFNYVLPDFGKLLIQFYDQMGRPVMPEINQEQEAGVYRMAFNVSDLRSGIYHYSFRFNGTLKTGTFIKQ